MRALPSRTFVLFCTFFASLSLCRIFLYTLHLPRTSTLHNIVVKPSDAEKGSHVPTSKQYQKKGSTAVDIIPRLFSITALSSGQGAAETSRKRSDYLNTAATVKGQMNTSQQQPMTVSTTPAPRVITYLPHLRTKTDIELRHHELPRIFTTCNSSSSPTTNSSLVDVLLASNTSLTLLTAYSQLLNSYVAWHRRVSQGSHSDPCVKVLSWTGSATAGLGDRMRGMLHAAILAIETKRYIVLHPPRGFPLGTFLLPNRITWWYTHSIPPRTNLTSLDFWGLSGIHRHDIQNVYGTDGFQATHGQYPNIEISSRTFPHFERMVDTQWYRRNCRLRRLRRCDYLGDENLAINRLIHDALFRFTPSAVEKARAVAAKHDMQHYIAVHARIGGKLDPLPGRFQKFNIDLDKTAQRLLRCVQIGRARFGISKLPIYLATDDEKFRTVFEKHAINFTDRFIMSAIKPVHSKVSCADGRRRNAKEERNLNALSDTVTETLVLGGARLIVTTGSGMSNYAAITGNAKLLTIRDCKDDSKLK